MRLLILAAAALPLALPLVLQLGGGPALAQGQANVTRGQAEAKEAARSANCTPANVEVLAYTPGRVPQTVFKITCTEYAESFVVIQCRERTCSVLR